MINKMIRKGTEIMEVTGKKVFVAGAGKSGIHAAKLLLGRGAQVVLFDENTKETREALLEKLDGSPDAQIMIGALDESALEDTAFMVISPGIPVDAPFTEKFRERNIEIWSEIELAYRLSSGQLAAITGTNGKTTTTSLVGEIMKMWKDSVFVVGNIGIPYTHVANDIRPDSMVVLEVSSFQLETIHEFAPKVSAILNLTPDHLNRHYTFENYADTKLKITMNQGESDICVLNYDDPVTRQMGEDLTAAGRPRVVYFSRLHNLDEGICIEEEQIVIRDAGKKIPVLRLADIRLLGGHNIENYMAAIGISYCMGVPVETIEAACKTFAGVEHRIEYVRTVNGVDYYNDSKGTNPDAAIKAVEAMVKPTILIGGGYDKQSAYDEWIDAFGDKVRHLVLIGVTAQAIAKTARAHGFTAIHFADSLEEAVKICAGLAGEGDAVLLSPACASWDMFKSYEQRGELFKEYVRAL